MRKNISKLIFIQLLLVFSASSDAEEWDHRIGTYLLTITLDATSAVNTPGGIAEMPIDMDFGDVTDNLNLIGVVYYQASKGPWSIDVDLTHAELEMDNSFDAPVPEPPGPATATLDVEMTIDEREVFAGYRFYEDEDSEIQFLFGARYYKHDIDIEVEVGPLEFEPGLGSSWTDPILGFRYRQQITQKWDWLARVDAGGFDVGSASKLSYKVELGASYKINQKWLFGVGYRYLAIDYEDGDTTDSDYYAYDGNESGLLLGILYKI